MCTLFARRLPSFFCLSLTEKRQQSTENLAVQGNMILLYQVVPSGQKSRAGNSELNKPIVWVKFLEFANKPIMGALSLKIRISQLWGHIVS